MANTRLDLQKVLLDLVGSPIKVYFQPPSTVKMTYPCVVYSRSNATTKSADNIPYLRMKRYQVTVIDADPDSIIPEKIEALPMCTFDRQFTADNLYHDVFSLYF